MSFKCFGWGSKLVRNRVLVDMSVVLFNIDGHRPSGIASFCRLLGETVPSSLVVSLNENSNVPWFENELQIPWQLSHKGDVIASLAFERLNRSSEAGDEWIIFPNVGDVCHYAAVVLAKLIHRSFGASVKIVGVCHSDDEGQYGVLRYYQEALSSIGYVSQHVGRRLGQLLPGCLNKLFRVDYPIDLGLWGRETIVESPSGEPLELLYMGRLDRQQKRVDRLVELIRKLVDARLDFKLTVIGVGLDGDCLRNEIGLILEPSGEQERVQFLGMQSHHEAALILRGKQIFLLVSEYEGTPIAMLEAMAAGLCPVVMYIDSGIPDVITSHENGVIVDQGDVDSMVLELVRMHENRERLDSCRLAARTSVAGRNSVHACWERIVTAVLDKSPPQPIKIQEFTQSIDYEDLKEFSKMLLVRHSCRIGVFGSGSLGRQFIDVFSEMGGLVVALFDSDQSKWGEFYAEIECQPPREIPGAELDLLFIASRAFVDDITGTVFRVVETFGGDAPELLFLGKA